MANVRLYVDHSLGAGQSLPLTREQAHYLFGVMRLGTGATLSLFNGSDGEWQAEVSEAGKRGGVLTCVTRTKALQLPPDLWLCFAPIKKARTDFIVEKAVEMGAARIVPMLTDFTNSERVRVDRLQAHAVEAAEQCGATWVPEVTAPVKLDRLLHDWDATRHILFCDEGKAGQALPLPDPPPAPGAFPFGPRPPPHRPRSRHRPPPSPGVPTPAPTPRDSIRCSVGTSPW